LVSREPEAISSRGGAGLSSLPADSTKLENHVFSAGAAGAGFAGFAGAATGAGSGALAAAGFIAGSSRRVSTLGFGAATGRGAAAGAVAGTDAATGAVAGIEAATGAGLAAAAGLAKGAVGAAGAATPFWVCGGALDK